MRRNKQKFFDQNPHCCFCGGSTKAIERDHIPPKCVFRDKNLPGDISRIEFPACSRCNQGWRLRDQAVAAIAILCGCQNCDTSQNKSDLKRAAGYLSRSKIAQKIVHVETAKPALVTEKGLLVPKLKAVFDWTSLFELVAESSAKYAVAYYYQYSKNPLPAGSLIASMAIPSETAGSIWKLIGPLVAQKQNDLSTTKENYSDQFQIWVSHNSNFSLFSAAIQIRSNFRSLVIIKSDALGAPHDLFDRSEFRKRFNIYEVQDGAPIVLKYSAKSIQFPMSAEATHSSFYA